MADLFEAVDLAVDTNPLGLRDVLNAVLNLDQRADTFSHHPEDIGYCEAVRDMRRAIASALGIQEGDTDVRS